MISSGKTANQPQRSLRAVLLSALLLPNVIFFAFAGIGSVLIAKDATKHAYDDALTDSLRTIVRQLKKVGGVVVLDLSPEAIQALEYDATDSWYFAITYPDGTPIAQNHHLPSWPVSTKGLTYFDSEIEDEDVRGVIGKVKVTGSGEETIVIAQVVETMRGRALTMQRVIVFVIGLLFALMVLNLIAIFAAVRIILRPIERLQDSVAERTLNNLDSLHVKNVYKELTPLVAAIDSLLSRLKNELDGQKEFLSHVAHTLRTRLAGIKLHAQLAARNSAQSESTEAFRRVETAINDLVEEVVKILMLVRSEQQERKLEAFTPIDLNQICHEVIKAFQITADSRRITLQYTGDVGGSMILGVAESLRILFENLVDNALRFSPIGSVVRVSISEVGDKVIAAVEDSGPGISSKTKEKLFSPFYRSPDAPLGGTGLGLSIARRVAEHHSATITVEDSTLGGARLAVVFPMQRESKLPSQTPIVRSVG